MTVPAFTLVELGLMIPALLSRIAASFIPPDEWLHDPMLPQSDPDTRECPGVTGAGRMERS